MKTLIVAAIAAVVAAFLALIYADVINTMILRNVDFTPIEDEPGGGWGEPWIDIDNDAWQRVNTATWSPPPRGWLVT